MATGLATPLPRSGGQADEAHAEDGGACGSVTGGSVTGSVTGPQIGPPLGRDECDKSSPGFTQGVEDPLAELRREVLALAERLGWPELETEHCLTAPDADAWRWQVARMGEGVLREVLEALRARLRGASRGSPHPSGSRWGPCPGCGHFQFPAGSCPLCGAEVEASAGRGGAPGGGRVPRPAPVSRDADPALPGPRILRWRDVYPGDWEAWDDELCRKWRRQALEEAEVEGWVCVYVGEDIWVGPGEEEWRDFALHAPVHLVNAALLRLDDWRALRRGRR